MLSIATFFRRHFKAIHKLISLVVVTCLITQLGVGAFMPVRATVSQTPEGSPSDQNNVAESGNIAAALYLPLIGKNFRPSQPITATILPGSGGDLISPDGKVHVTFAGEAVNEPAIVEYIPLPAPSLPPNHLGTGGPAFELKVQTLNGTPINQFPYLVDVIPTQGNTPAISVITPTVTIEIHYTQGDVTGLDLRSFFLYTRANNNQEWYRAPSATYQDQQLVLAYVEQLGQFVPLAPVSGAMLGASGENKRLALDPDDNVGHATWPGTGQVWEGPYAYQLGAEIQQRFIDDECHIDIVLTRDASQQNGFVSRALRAQTAVNFNAEIFTTLAFNALLGEPWGSSVDGGVRTWARSGQPNDDLLANQYRARIPEYTGRPSTLNVQHPSLYGEFNNPGILPTNIVYAHSETLFLDHNFDWPVINTEFDLIVDAMYAALATRLADMGLTCGPDNQPPEIPPPPSAEVLQRLRDLGNQNMRTYGTKYDLIWARMYQMYGADPVSFSTGNFIKQVDLFTLPGRGGLDFHFNLTYNAQDGRADLFGYGWSFPYSIHTQRYNDDSVSVILHDGRTFHYTWDGSNYIPPAGVLEELRRTTDGWEWETMDETILTFADTITGQGILTQWQNQQGNRLYFTHDLSGQDDWEDGNPVPRPPLTEIQDDAGRVITFVSNSSSFITDIHSFDGRSFHFDYDGEGNLVALTDGNGGTQTFQYDARHRMTHLRDAENILYLQNSYDSRDRVVGQIDASGATNTLVYDDVARETTYTDNLGNQQVYSWDALNRVTAFEDGTGNAESYVFDANYNITSYTDPNGNTTEYTYDADGNLIERKDPIDPFSYIYYQSDVSRWLYNDQNLVISYTNALTHTWLYDYDNDGNLIYTLAPNGSETFAAYNSWGQPTVITDSLGRATRFFYDNTGNLLDTVYPDNSSTHSTYDTAGRELSFTDANGHTVFFEYDANDNITRIIDPRGNDSLFFYDDNNLLIRHINRRGAEMLYQYDENLKLIAERDGELNWTYYGYDAMYNRNVMTDTLGYATHYAYDADYNLILMTDANGFETRYEYDANGNLTAIIDPQGYRTEFVYDGVNRVKFLIDAEGNRTEFCYDAEDQLIRVFDPRRALTQYEYDAVGNMSRIIDPYARVTAYQYDLVQNMTATIDPLSQRTDYTYDAMDRVETILRPILPDGQRPMVQFEYDNVGNTITITNPMGAMTSFAYDENDNVVLITDALGGEIEYAYDEEDNATLVTDQNGNLTAVTYNLVDLPITIEDGLGYTSTLAYDSVYNLINQTDAMGRVITYTYDALGWLLATIDPLGNTTTYDYNPVGDIRQVTDANGHSTVYDYDGLSRLIQVTDAISGTTHYTYDAVSNLITITDANGHTTRFEYNLYNQLKKETNPLGNSWWYYYDEMGRLNQSVDAMWRATYYEYDSNDRLTEIAYGSLPPTMEPISYTYDLNGNETMMCDQLGCTVHTYDLLDRPITTTDWLSRTITRTYDAVSNLTQLTYPNGYTVTYDYNANNWLTTFTNPHGESSHYLHNPAGQVTSLQHPNNTIASYQYDGAGRLIGIDHRLVGALQPQNAYAYALDAVGNRIEVQEIRSAFDGSNNLVTLNHAYTYDPLNRLVNATTALPTTDTAYLFDPVGNRLEKTGTVLTPDTTNPQLPVAPRPEQVNYSYNAANQLLTANNTSFAYDPNGNRIQETEVLTTGVTLLTDYEFDRRDRLVGVTKGISSTGNITVTMVATYTYDGYDRRAFKEVTYPGGITPTQVITYLYDGLDIIGAQIETSSTITNSYYYLAQSPVTGMRRPFILERLPNPITAFPGDIYWYQTDGLDSVTTLTDSVGTATSPYLYDEYGNSLANNTLLQIFTYTSQDYDPETGFHHFYARYYDPNQGTWLSADPYRGLYSLPVTLHRYGYVYNNPVTSIDEKGYLGLLALGAAVFLGFALLAASPEPVHAPTNQLPTNTQKPTSGELIGRTAKEAMERALKEAQAKQEAADRYTNLEVPHIDQLSYSGKHEGYEEYICSAASLTMALQYYLGSSITLNDVADDLVDLNYLDHRGLLSGDYLHKYVQANQGKYKVKTEYFNEPFSRDKIKDSLKSNTLMIINVPGHYTLITGFKEIDNGSYLYKVNDPYRGHWGSQNTNSILNKEWISEEELKSIWKNRGTLVSAQ